MDKEFVLVSQGIEIMRTKSQENAINYVKKNNDKWFDYVQKCKDNYEQYADNYIELYVEDEYTKKIEQENKQLKEILNEIKNIDIFKEFSFPLMKRWEEQQVLSSIDYQFKNTFIRKINELESSDSNEL